MRTRKETIPEPIIYKHRRCLYLISLILMFALGVNGQTMYISSPGINESIMRKKVRQVYTSQLGIREKQPNSGPAVEQYLRYVDLKKGNPWCAAFVCWVFGRAGVGNPRTGWSPGLFPDDRVIWSREPRTRSQESGLPANVPIFNLSNLTTKNEQTPSTGDVFGIYFPEKGRIAHVGFVDEWDGTWLVTVEGNTNISGSREGDGVYRKRRLVRSVYKVARYVE